MDELMENLLTLNDYLVVKIFKRLKLRHQLKILVANPRFQDIFVDHGFMRPYERIEEPFELYCGAKRKFFEMMGGHVHYYNKKLMSFHTDIDLTCFPNLQHLITPVYNCNISHIVQLSYLEHLDIDLRSVDPLIFGKYSNCLKYLVYLRTLKLRHVMLEGLNIPVLRNVQWLEIHESPGITKNCLQRLCIGMRQLRHLDIFSLNCVDIDVFYCIVVMCKKLERLAICSTWRLPYEWLERLPKLRYLKVNNYSNPVQLLQTLGSKFGTTLQSLTLHGIHFSDEEWDLIGYFTNLREFKIETICGHALKNLVKLKSLEHLHFKVNYLNLNNWTNLLNSFEHLTAIYYEYCRYDYQVILTAVRMWKAEHPSRKNFRFHVYHPAPTANLVEDGTLVLENKSFDENATLMNEELA